MNKRNRGKCKLTGATYIPLLFAFSLSLFTFTSCDVKDPIYEASLTTHPEHGKITLTTDWSGRGTDIDIPAEYTVNMGDFTENYTLPTHTPDKLFDPGTYTLYVYNQPGNPAIGGTTATADYAAGMLGWLFTSAQAVTIEADKVHELTVIMQQQVRQLTLIIEPTGGTADKIESIAATLSGVAGTLDFNTGAHGTPSDVGLTFTKGTDGKWTATVRLLGVTGTVQMLTGAIHYTDGLFDDMPLESDLSSKLTDFNANKREPKRLKGPVTETPTGAGFTAIINDWEKVPGTGTAD